MVRRLGIQIFRANTAFTCKFTFASITVLYLPMYMFNWIFITNEPGRKTTYLTIPVLNEDSDQTAHPRSLTKFFGKHSLDCPRIQVFFKWAMKTENKNLTGCHWKQRTHKRTKIGVSVSLRRLIWQYSAYALPPRSMRLKTARLSCKRCRPWSDAAFCGVWSGSTPLAQAYLSQYNKTWYSGRLY